MQIQRIPPQDWPELAGRFADFGFEQSRTYTEAAAARIGAAADFLALRQDGAPVAAAAVRTKRVPVLGRGIAWIAAGPLTVPLDGPPPDAGTLSAVLRALRDEIAVRRGHVLRLRLPATGGHDAATVGTLAGQAGFHPTDRAPVYRTVLIDPSRDDDALMKSFDGKWRTDLRYALKSGLELETGRSPALRARFLSLFAEVQQAKGFRPGVAPETHFALTGEDYDWEVLVASKDGTDLAANVIGWSGGTAVYLFGATAEAGRRLRAGYFLTWCSLRRSRDRGLRWYDMGGIDEVENPSVARFKLRMNGLAVEAAGPYEARGRGPVPGLIAGLETARARWKGAR